jgi:hypothetical protein
VDRARETPPGDATLMVTIALLCLVPLPVLSVEDRVAVAMIAPLEEVLGADRR